VDSYKLLHSITTRFWARNINLYSSPAIIGTVKSRRMWRGRDRSLGNRKLRREDNIIMDVRKSV
jgi:hypothetical protein